jgi:glucose-6-phosphate isomerase
MTSSRPLGLPLTPPQSRPQWARLTSLAASTPSLKALLKSTQPRGSLRWEACGITLDAQHQRLEAGVSHALNDLARACDLPGQLQAMAAGDIVNHTEQRAALHMSLRGPVDGPWGSEIGEAVHAARETMLRMAQTVYDQRMIGARGLGLNTVVNIGIGGSDTGPRLLVDALGAKGRGPDVVFLSVPDAQHMEQTLAGLDPHRTLVVISSKTFTTQETMAIAGRLKQWLLASGLTPTELGQQLVAITTAVSRAREFGVPADHILPFWDWVGGRFSVWSSIGFAAAAKIGRAAFEDFLAGAQAMDAHLLSAPIEENMPMQLALHGIWNRNFLGCASLVVAPYRAALSHLVPYVQQLDMESNGKSVHWNGMPCEVQTGPTIFGGVGITGQHAYFQLLHQGTQTVPVEFIGVRPSLGEDGQVDSLTAILVANMLAQSEALAMGRDADQTQASLAAEGQKDSEVAALTPHRSYPGGRPSSLIWLDALSALQLGSLVALYEHKVVCQAMVWGINPFDQWGVELGKSMAQRCDILRVLAK